MNILPAVHRDRHSSDPIERLVWVIEFIPMTSADPRFPAEVEAVCVPEDGRLFMAKLSELEVVGWELDDRAMNLARPPSYEVASEKIRSITDRPART